MKRLLYIAPLIVVLVIVGYFASGLTRDPHELPSALIDRPFPVVDLPPIIGHEKGFATADLAGQVALVNIFASWCVPCKLEHPLLMAHDLLEQDGNPYRLVGADRTGRAAIGLGVTGVPETYLVDKTGHIRYKLARPITEDDWTQVLQPLMAKLAAE
jgi:cytochrome c biogenesis protein CcmG/thiol:disulfide interchange protein DsbE